MSAFSRVPPGFRFHPTDEELVNYYLRKKVSSRKIDLDVIKDVDLYKIEPWDLQELCRISTEEPLEWYFFSHKDKKYPTGTRTNRATAAGFWKATGRDKAIYLNRELIGMRKTLVFYQGRAPNGHKSDWIMHEYRLENDENGAPQEEGWAVCKVFKKRLPNIRTLGEPGSLGWYDDQSSFIPNLASPNQTLNPNCNQGNYPNYHCKKELDLLYQSSSSQEHFLHLPTYLNNPKLNNLPFTHMNQSNAHHQPSISSSSLTQDETLVHSLINGAVDQVTDWRVLDKFVASQLSQEEVHDDVTTNSIETDPEQATI